MKDSFYLYYRSIATLWTIGPREMGLLKGEYIILMLVYSLFERNSGTVTQLDVVRSNPIPKRTTYTHLNSLVEKGYLLKARKHNQFFSRSYLTLTDKALLLQSRIKSLLEE